MVTGYSVSPEPGSSSFSLAGAAVGPQRLQLEGIDARALVREAGGDHAGQSQVDVVAAEEDVLADRDALEHQIAPLLFAPR